MLLNPIFLINPMKFPLLILSFSLLLFFGCVQTGISEDFCNGIKNAELKANCLESNASDTPEIRAEFAKTDLFLEDIQAYGEIIQKDSDDLQTLADEQEPIVEDFNNAATLEERKQAYNDYLAWSRKFINKMEISQS